MKLRNKKTGEIATLDSEHTASLADFGGKLLIEAGSKEFSYDTLAELNEDWEDYKPAEPLIKDEKIRKAVRAWAEATEVEKLAVMCHSVWEGTVTEIAKIDDIRLRIVFSGDLGIKMGSYTITELCGEEEK